MEEVVGCAKQHQGETYNQPEDGVMLGEEAVLPSRRQGSRKKMVLLPDVIPLSQNPWHGIVGEGEYGTTTYFVDIGLVEKPISTYMS
jgi:hypothetical protein